MYGTGSRGGLVRERLLGRNSTEVDRSFDA